MKNVNLMQPYSFKNITVTNGSSSSSTGSGSYQAVLVNSSTNINQNIGDHVHYTPYSYTVNRSSATNLYGHTKTAPGPIVTERWVEGVIGSRGFAGPSAAEISSATNAASFSAASNLSDSIRGTLDLAVDAAESGQMWRTIEKRTLHLVHEARRVRNQIKRGQIDRVFADLWLEARYGWIPTLNSIYDVSRMLHDNPASPPQIKRSGSSRISVEFNKPDSFTVNNIPFGGTSHGTYSRFHSYKAFLSSNKLGNAQRAANWTSMNPASIAWELLPYSFVVDWIYDIGGYLRQAETALIYAPSVSSVGYSQLSAWNCRNIAYVKPPVGMTGDGHAGQSNKVISFSRSTSGSLPVRSPVLHLGSMGFNRWVSAAALLRQIF